MRNTKMLASVRLASIWW